MVLALETSLSNLLIETVKWNEWSYQGGIKVQSFVKSLVSHRNCESCSQSRHICLSHIHPFKEWEDSEVHSLVALESSSNLILISTHWKGSNMAKLRFFARPTWFRNRIFLLEAYPMERDTEKENSAPKGGKWKNDGPELRIGGLPMSCWWSKKE